MIGVIVISDKRLASTGPILFKYYVINDKCYVLRPTDNSNKIGDEISAERISKHISDNYYEIEGVSPNRQIAFKYMGKFYRLNYISETQYSINNQVYTLKVNQIVEDRGDYITTVNGFKVFAAKGYPNAIAIELEDNIFTLATLGQ